MPDNFDGLMRLITPRLPAERRDRFAGGYITTGVVVSTDAKGIRFTLPQLDGGKAHFGPAPSMFIANLSGIWYPKPGDGVLVVFRGGGLADPWVLASDPPITLIISLP